MTHDAWKPRPPEWVSLAPGVSWLIHPITGDLQALVNASVAKTVSDVYTGRGALEDMGFEASDLGVLGDLDVLSGFSVYCAAVFTAERVVEAWRGIDDADTGEAIEVTPESIRAALRFGTPEGGPALLQPFMAWLDRPRQPIAAEVRRLREFAKWEHGGGAAHCDGCDQFGADCARGGTDAGDRCPRFVNAPQTEPGLAAWAAAKHQGVWVRAGMAGQLVGLNYAACLEIARAGEARIDEGAVIRCLGAIEQGALEAAAEKAKET